MIKRILVIASCVTLLVCSFALPVSAVGVDYNDLISNIVVDGDNDLVTVSVPSEYMSITVYEPSTGFYLYSDSGDSATVSLLAEHSYFVIFRAFEIDRLFMNNIPDKTLTIFEFSVSTTGSYDTPFLTTLWDFWNSNNEYLTSQSVPYSNSPIDGNYRVEHTLLKPAGSYFGCASLNYANFSPLTSREVTFTMESLDLVFSISSLYRLQQQSGKTNEILSEVEKQLADQGKTLDEVLGAQKDTNDKLDGIINDKVDSTPPSGGGAVGDLDDAEGQIRDDAQSGLDQGLDVQQSALQILQQYWSAFACVDWIFNKFVDLPFFSGLLYVSFALGITGAILGLGLSLARGGDARAGRQAAAEARQNSYYRRLGRGKKGG